MKILSIVPLQLSVFGSVTLYWREDSVSRVAVKAAIDGIRQVVQEFVKDGDTRHPAVGFPRRKSNTKQKK